MGQQLSIKTYHGGTERRRKKKKKRIFLVVSAVDLHCLMADC